MIYNVRKVEFYWYDPFLEIEKRLQIRFSYKKEVFSDHKIEKKIFVISFINV